MSSLAWHCMAWLGSNMGFHFFLMHGGFLASERPFRELAGSWTCAFFPFVPGPKDNETKDRVDMN